MSVTDEIKNRLDIVDFIGNYVSLKKAGRNYKALCPFHAEKTPSFVVFPDSQQWRCFGACGEGGDIFSFVMKREGWDFPEALRFLAQQAGVELAPPTPEQAQAQEAHERLRELLAEAAHFFQRQLLQAPNAEHARRYVAQRGLSAETIESFGLGYAPASWDATMNRLLEQGYERQDLIDAGLLVVKDDGGVYDRFRDRLMIPIHDPRGRVVGFGARALAPEAEPKYLNSPQSPVFDKSSLLYGFPHARRTIRQSETAVIVEGYMDVMQAHQAGFTNVVAQMGTALTEPQLRLLARYANRLVLALDPDIAGQMATDRGREVIERVSKEAAQQVSREGVWEFDTAEREYGARVTPEFDARGMLRYEGRLGFDIRVAVLPHGKDPDDLIREAPSAWAALVEGALPIVEYAIQKTVEGQNLDDAKVKSHIAARVVPLIEDISDPIERSHYRQRLARLLKVPENTLFPARPGRVARPGGRQRPRASQPPPGPPADAGVPRLDVAPTRSREAFCLAALIRHPRLLYEVNRILAEFLAPEQVAGALPERFAHRSGYPSDALAWTVTASDFAHPEHRRIFETWLAALDQDEVDPVAYLMSALDPVTREIAAQWLALPLYALRREVKPPDAELSYEKIFEEVVRGLLALRESRLDELFSEFTFLMQDAENGGDALTARQHGDMIRLLFFARQRIEKALKRYGLRGGRIGTTSMVV